MKIYTIGHSNHSLEKLLGLLEDNGVMSVVDVRTAPFSRYSPHFNRDELAAALSHNDIQYAFAGKYLGGRPSDPLCYKSHTLPVEGADYLHEVDYPEVMKRAWFIKGIDRLLEMADEQSTAVLCSEENPAQCHRHHLIARYIMAQHPDVKVRHIRGDGTEYGAETLLGSVDEPLAIQSSLF
jgi:uncharacterized protein (DUF488 family)